MFVSVGLNDLNFVSLVTILGQSGAGETYTVYWFLMKNRKFKIVCDWSVLKGNVAYKKLSLSE